MIWIMIAVVVITISATISCMLVLIVKELMDSRLEDEPRINGYHPCNDDDGNEEFDWGHNIRNYMEE